MSTQHNDPVEIELDLSTISVADLEGDGSPPAGKYHAKIEGVQRVSDQTSYLKVRFALLAGTDPAGVGCVFSERFYLSEKAVKRLAILGHRLQLIAGDDLGGRSTVDWSQAIGRQLIVEVVEEEFERKDGTKAKRAKLSYAGFWDVNDQRVASVPKDAAALKQKATPPKTMPATPKPPKYNPDELDI
jgi:hypothetical protein